MSDLFWPGDARAGALMSDQAFVDAMVSVEAAWLGVPLETVDADKLDSDGAGNPVPSLVALLRRQRPGDRIHVGLTSQDVIDSALMICLRDTVAAIHDDVREQVRFLVGLIELYRETPMVARTLTQHAVPTTFGFKAAQWLGGILGAHEDLAGLSYPIQLGGAAGTMAAALQLGRDPAGDRAELAATLGLEVGLSWHTARRPVTRIGDALVTVNDAWGHIGNDVLTLSRPEMGELSEGKPGSSSTMPHKQNPVLATLIRRAALTAPALGATLHLAAAEQGDERAPGAWHAEWATLRDLGRRTVVAGSQLTDLLGGLVVHPERMRATLEAAHDAVRSEQQAMIGVSGRAPLPDYLGESVSAVDSYLVRAKEILR